jgi:hypothetical protein
MEEIGNPRMHQDKNGQHDGQGYHDSIVDA